MFAFVSSTCIPLHSFNFTYHTLIRSKKSFIEILPNEPGAYDRWAARGEEIMLPEIPFEKFRIGSQFFVLTRKHARIVVQDRRSQSKHLSLVMLIGHSSLHHSCRDDITYGSEVK
ncbi:hypothetical protein MKW94_015227 [Papaver nudicaule]|uniref:Uncharacterized protein n=1 Tax=Papaver nudicaule TaxID=74823 RepID=A0AA42AVN3_PAPNU|nr:hypothetical protein [Papaver nudicaule]